MGRSVSSIGPPTRTEQFAYPLINKLWPSGCFHWMLRSINYQASFTIACCTYKLSHSLLLQCAWLKAAMENRLDAHKYGTPTHATALPMDSIDEKHTFILLSVSLLYIHDGSAFNWWKTYLYIIISFIALDSWWQCMITCPRLKGNERKK